MCPDIRVPIYIISVHISSLSRDVVVSEEVGNFVKVDEKVVATTRHVAEEEEVDHSYRRIVDHDESDEVHYREDFDHLAPARIVEPEVGEGKKGKGKKKHGVSDESLSFA